MDFHFYNLRSLYNIDANVYNSVNQLKKSQFPVNGQKHENFILNNNGCFLMR